MKKITTFFLLIVFFTTYSCLDRIDFQVPGKERETIIIQGKLAFGSPSRAEAQITKLFDFTASSVTPIDVRSCVLVDEDGNTKSLERTDRNTYEAIIFAADPEMTIEFGKQYMMRVETFDGRTFESSLEVLDDVPQPESLSIEYFDRNDSVGIANPWLRLGISTPTVLSDGSPARLRWDIQEVARVTDSPVSRNPNNPIEPTTCYVFNTLDNTRVVLIDGEEFSGDRVDNLQIVESPIKTTYREGVYLNVFQESLSRDAFEYWENVSDVISREGSMFDPPAGKIFTNFKNIKDPVEDEIFGYFYASSQKVIRTYISPEDLGNPPKFCPPPTQGQNPGRTCNLPPVCCDCAALANSVTERPLWWIE